MGTWGDIERELLANRLPNGAPDLDKVRRKHLKALAEYTKRSCIVYATNGFSPRPGASSPADILVTLDPDIAGFMETVHGIPKDVPLDLILHSPGGHAEAAEAIISYLRGRFPGLRVIVPVAAMSAATMMAMAADEIVMAAHSQLGPIDPQLTITTTEGPRTSPAAAIRAQFAQAQADLAANPAHMAAWLPILRSMSPALLQMCENAEKLSKTMVKEWLQKYMFQGQIDAQKKAEAITEYLSDYQQFMSHGRRVDREALRRVGVRVVDLEADQQLQDRVLSVYHAVSHTMALSGTVKIIENHLGKGMFRAVNMVAVGGPSVPAQPGAQAVPGVPKAIPSGPPISRQQRRAAARKGQAR
jgi:hypothetical protein